MARQPSDTGIRLGWFDLSSHVVSTDDPFGRAVNPSIGGFGHSQRQASRRLMCERPIGPFADQPVSGMKP